MPCSVPWACAAFIFQELCHVIYLWLSSSSHLLRHHCPPVISAGRWKEKKSLGVPLETQPCCCQHFLCVCQNKAASQLFYQRSSPPCHSLCCIPVVTAKTTPIRLGSASHRTEKKKKKRVFYTPAIKGLHIASVGACPAPQSPPKLLQSTTNSPVGKHPSGCLFSSFLNFTFQLHPLIPATGAAFWLTATKTSTTHANFSIHMKSFRGLGCISLGSQHITCSRNYL